MRRLHEAFQLVKINLAQAREQQKIQYDKRVKIAEFNVGDKVLLDLRTPIIGVSKKLIPPFVGPYRILKMCNNSTVEIQKCSP
jgi:ribosomal protein L19